MQSELCDHPLDAPGADDLTTLAQLLSDHICGGLRVQKAVAHHLLKDLAGAAVRGLGPALLVVEGRGALGLESVKELEVALFAEAEFLGGGGRTQALALPFVEHGELGEDGIGSRSEQSARGPGELERVGM